MKAKTRNIDVLTAIFNEQIMAAKGELSPRGTHIEALKRAQELCTTFTFEPEKQDEAEAYAGVADSYQFRSRLVLPLT